MPTKEQRQYRSVIVIAALLIAGFVIRATSQTQTISVPAGADLQAAVNAAPAGATLITAEGATYVTNLVVNKSLTIQGKSTIRTPNADPAIYIPPKTANVIIRNLEITTTAGWPQVHDIVRIGDDKTTNAADVPSNITLDNVFIHGQPTQEVQRGISGNGANISVLNSRITEIHGRGYDTQAFGSWNGPGPFRIINCTLEASGENIMFGGALASIPGLIPTGIEIRGNLIRKPLTWKKGDPSFVPLPPLANSSLDHWTVKNLLEIKNGRDIVIDSNTLENSWTDAQAGYALMFTVRGEGNNQMPQATIQNVTVSNNIIRNADQGLQTLGLDNLNASTRASGLTVINNSFENIKNWGFVISGYHNVRIEHNTHIQNGNIIVFTGDQSPGFIYRNNATVRGPNSFGVFGDGKSEGKVSIDAFAPGAVFAGNVIAGALERLYPVGNFFPPDLSTLASFKGTDGLTPGRGTSLATPTPTPLPSPSPSPSVTPLPSPVPSPTVTPTPSVEVEIRKCSRDVPTQKAQIKTAQTEGFEFIGAAEDSKSNNLFCYFKKGR